MARRRNPKPKVSRAYYDRAVATRGPAMQRLSPVQSRGASPSSGHTVKAHKPRNTWHQRGWSDVSPFYSNTVTRDPRWDK